MTQECIRTEVSTNGFAIVESVLSPELITDLLEDLERVQSTASVRQRGAIFAIRNLLDVSTKIKSLANSDPIRALIEPILGRHCFPIRSLLFDKVPQANWKVPWHQDLTIAVQERVKADGFGPWSVKANVLHVQPPSSLLKNMLTLRLHLDPCGEENGALRVRPKSRLYGKIPEQEIAAFRASLNEKICIVGVGGALLMRPLLLHASSPALLPRHRRVIHLDFTSSSPPAGLQWLSQQS